MNFLKFFILFGQKKKFFILIVLKFNNKYCLLFSRTQLPHAVGAAYSLKMDNKDACVATYFGDGGSSEVNTLTLKFKINIFIFGFKESGTFVFCIF